MLTIVVISGDNGMPFPRCKATLYDQGTRVPLAIRWGAINKQRRKVADFVTLCDLAPTFLDAACLQPPQQMTGRSLLPILVSRDDTLADSSRTFVVTGVEKHIYPYPKRAFRTKNFLYIRNFNPERWKAGEVSGQNQEYDFARTPWPIGPGAFSFAIDPSPTKQFLRLNRNEPNVKPFADRCFPRWPTEELYDLRSDPEQLRNVAADEAYASTCSRLKRRLTAELIKSNDPRASVSGYTSQDVKGWPVRVSDALEKDSPEETKKTLFLLTGQLQKVLDAVPAEALAHLQTVPIWLSPKYDGYRPRGEYHAGADWLQDQGRHPELHQCIEFSNTEIFDREVVRMPVMVLHELAHAYHHQVLGFDDVEVKTAYERAASSGSYEAVLRSNGTTQKAYALENRKEYFAECSEAFFGVNDFYPFNRRELDKHDPVMAKLLAKLWHTNVDN